MLAQNTIDNLSYELLKVIYVKGGVIDRSKESLCANHENFGASNKNRIVIRRMN